MVLADILTETRKRWLKAFKLFKGYRGRRGTKGNRVSPALVRSPSYSGTVDARSEIDTRGLCFCRASPPALPRVPAYENASYDSRDSSSGSLERYATRSSDFSDSGFENGNATAGSGRRSGYGSGCSDSAYDSDCARGSPARPYPIRITTVSYFNVNDSEDSSSVRTECTLLEYDNGELDEYAQNAYNESLELGTSL